MSTKGNLLLVGATGRMGREIIDSAARSGLTVVGGIVEEGNPLSGKHLPGVEAPLCEGWCDEFRSAEVVIDFSSHEGTVTALEIAYQQKIPVVIGTTGLTQALDPIFKKVSEGVPVVKTSNTSVGVNILLQLVREATTLFGESVEIEIVEAHHRAKKDAPSGTALTIAEAIQSARGRKSPLVSGREGKAEVRTADEIGIHAIRGGDVVGEHTVLYLGDGERVEIAHKVTKRSAFADGAVRAALWALAKWNSDRTTSPGLYSMADVLRSDPRAR
jgi:4-hydroxy-tetrahydrodipicolinate reductase